MPEPALGHDDVLLVRADNPGLMTLEGTNTYIVGRAPAWVIDPGPDDPAHLDAVRAAADERGGIGGVLLTHSHADHSAGVEPLGAPLLWGAVAEGDESSWQPSPDVRPAAEAPDVFDVIPTPGHAPDHSVFLYGDVLFCGDLILGHGSSIVPPELYGGSLADYRASRERVAGLGATLFAPGHGPWITDPAATVAEYVKHRREREEKLVAALDSGERSREALLDAAWGDVPHVLRMAAAIAMQAHLEKLEAEGRLPDGIH